MIRFLRNISRYCLVCPVVFFTKQAGNYGLQWIKEGIVFLCNSGKILLVLWLCFSAWLIWYRSLEVYTYGLDEELEYLGRLPVIWEREKKIYLPPWYGKKSSTGRFVLKSRVKEHITGKGKLLIVHGEMRKNLPASHLMEFQLFS